MIGDPVKPTVSYGRIVQIGSDHDRPCRIRQKQVDDSASEGNAGKWVPSLPGPALPTATKSLLRFRGVANPTQYDPTSILHRSGIDLATNRIDPRSILDRSTIDPGSIPHRSWIDPGSVLDRSRIDTGSIQDRSRIYPGSILDRSRIDSVSRQDRFGVDA